MTLRTSQTLHQPFAYAATNNEPPIDNFDQWARLVRVQMLASLHRRSKSSPD